MRFLPLLLVLAACHREAPASLVFLNGHVTGSSATAVAVSGNAIAVVGSDAEIRKRVGEKTRVVDLAGRYVIASMTDAHGHMLWYGGSLAEVDLRGCTSVRDCAQRVAERCATSSDAWIFGHGWDDTAFTDKAPLTAKALDDACPGRAVWLRRVDEHAGWASTKTMELAGAKGDGIFVDANRAAIEATIPALTHAQRKAHLVAAQDSLVAMGLTSVHEMGIDLATEAVFRQLQDEGALKIRVVGYAEHGGLRVPLDEPALNARLKMKADAPTPDKLFTMQGVKLWADGALGSRGAALIEDYSDSPTKRGAALTDAAQIERIAKSAITTGWQLAVHAIGDAANRMVLDAYEHAGANGHRFRVEHAQVVAVGDLPRFAALGVLASMQPTHATSDMRWVGERIGEERLRGAYAWQTLKRTHAHIVLGSDFPVESPNPWEGLHAAVMRTNAANEPSGGWRPDEKLSRAEALDGFTRDAAYAAFQEGYRGEAKAGHVADLTIIDRDVLADTALRDVRVDMTVVGGRIVYER